MKFATYTLAIATLAMSCLDTPTFSSAGDSGASDTSETSDVVERDLGGDVNSVDLGEAVWHVDSAVQRVVVALPVSTSIDDVPVFIPFASKPMGSMVVTDEAGNRLPAERTNTGVWTNVERIDEEPKRLFVYFTRTDSDVNATPWMKYDYVLHFDQTADNVAGLELTTYTDGTGTVLGTENLEYEAGRYGDAAVFGSDVDQDPDTNMFVTLDSYRLGYVQPNRAITLDFWVRPNAVTASNPIVHMRNRCHGLTLRFEPTGSLLAEYDVDTDGCGDTSPVRRAVEIENIDSDQWMHVGVVVDRNRNKLSVVLNGQRKEDDLEIPDDATFEPDGGHFFVGYSRSQTFFSGELDEMRIQSVNRSPPWFAFQYNMGIDPNFIRVGPVKTKP